MNFARPGIAERANFFENFEIAEGAERGSESCSGHFNTLKC